MWGFYSGGYRLNKVIKDVESTYKEYSHLCSQLTKDISDFLLKRDISACISIEDEVCVEILFKVHYEDLNKMMLECDFFQKNIDALCEEFSLKVIHSETGQYEKMELPAEYRTFMYERVLLIGVKDE